MVKSFASTIISCLSWFITDNGFCTGTDNYAFPVHYGNWQGKISRYISVEEAEHILSCFLSESKDNFFSLFYVSDYKDTYIGKNLLQNGENIYLKRYRLRDASKEVRRRNILRRCLAKKSFNAFYQLNKKGIKAVSPLFYVMRKGRWIAEDVILVNKGSSSNHTVKSVMADLAGKEELHLLAMNLGYYVARLQSKGILFSELYQNLIAVNQGYFWSFVLCDLDEMRSLSEKRTFKHMKNIESLRDEIRHYGDVFVRDFDYGYYKQWRIIINEAKFQRNEKQKDSAFNSFGGII